MRKQRALLGQKNLPLSSGARERTKSTRFGDGSPEEGEKEETCGKSGRGGKKERKQFGGYADICSLY